MLYPQMNKIKIAPEIQMVHKSALHKYIIISTFKHMCREYIRRKIIAILINHLIFTKHAKNVVPVDRLALK